MIRSRWLPALALTALACGGEFDVVTPTRETVAPEVSDVNHQGDRTQSIVLRIGRGGGAVR